MPEPAAPAAAAASREAEEERPYGSRRSASDEGRGQAERLLKRFRGRAVEAIGHMSDENRRMRDERRAADAKLAEFTAAGVVVLKGDDAKAYEAYKALGKPDEIKIKLDELPALKTKVTESERRTASHDAAKHLGWNPEATAGMIVDKQLEVTLVDGKDAAGKDIKIPHVRPTADPKAVPVPLAKWQTDNASYLTPALTTKAAAQSSNGTNGAGPTAKGGTQFVEQSTGSSTAGDTKAKPAIPGRAAYMTPGQRAAAEKK